MANEGWTGERLEARLSGFVEIAEHLHRYALAQALAGGRDVLDIACGDGYGSNLMAQRARRVIGVDVSAATVAAAASRYRHERLEFKVGAADAVPLPASAIDLVVSFETLEHHDQHDAMLGEIKRVLRPGGALLMSTPDRAVYGRRDPANPFHVRELTLEEFEALLRRHFAHVRLHAQRMTFGSLIAPVGEQRLHADQIVSGGFDTLKPGPDLDGRMIGQPYFIVALAADRAEAAAGLPASYFDAATLFDEIVRRYEGENRALNDALNRTFFGLWRRAWRRLARLTGRAVG